MNLSLLSTQTLNNDVTIPIFGLGVWRTSPGSETLKAVLHALSVGYRHIDTAHFYKNESDVGEAIRQSGLIRTEIFVATKLWNDDHGYDRAIKALTKSLTDLRLDRIDLYLIHYPVSKLRRESWQALETLYEEGKCRAIGVSNYTIRHLEELLGYAKIKPVVNQVEFHPWLYQKELLDFCRKHGIAVEAYSPLTKGQKMNDPKLAVIAKKNGRSPAQILIRWGLQHGLIEIPKSAKPTRIDENANVFDFELSNDDMHELDSFHSDFRVAWDPTKTP